MDMTVQEPGPSILRTQRWEAFHLLTIAFVWEVGYDHLHMPKLQRKLAIEDRQACSLVATTPPIDLVLLLPSQALPALVMVPWNEKLRAIEELDQLKHLRYWTHGEVAEDVDLVRRINALVPALDEVDIHRLGIAIGALCMSEDSRMTEVQI